jgi:hypothetical protein
MAYKIDLLLKNPERMAKMRLRAKALGHPDAAESVIRTLISGYGVGGTVMIQPEDRSEKTKAKFRRIGKKLSFAQDDEKSAFPV